MWSQLVPIGASLLDRRRLSRRLAKAEEYASTVLATLHLDAVAPEAVGLVERGPSSFCFFASGALVPVLPYLLGTGAVVGLLSGASRSSERCASLPSDGMRGGYISHLASPGDYASAARHGISAPLAAMFLIRQCDLGALVALAATRRLSKDTPASHPQISRTRIAAAGSGSRRATRPASLVDIHALTEPAAAAVAALEPGIFMIISSPISRSWSAVPWPRSLSSPATPGHGSGPASPWVRRKA